MLMVFLAIVLVFVTACSTSNNNAQSENMGSNQNEVDDQNEASGKTEEELKEEAIKKEAEFFKGKTLDVIIVSSAGGLVDRTGRVIGKYIQDELGVASVRFMNEPGGGQRNGTNKIYNAPPDGLTIGGFHAMAGVLNNMIEDEGSNYDVRKMNWLGTTTDDPLLLLTKGGSPYKTIKDFIDSDRTVVGMANGMGNIVYYSLGMINNALGLNNEVITGYAGLSEIIAGFIRGDGDQIISSYTGAKELIEAGDAQAVVQLTNTRWAGLPDVPTLVESAAEAGVDQETLDILKTIAGLQEFGLCYFIGPDVPKERVEFIQAAFKRVFENPEFIAEAEQNGMYPGYAPPESIMEKINSAYEVADKIKSYVVQ